MKEVTEDRNIGYDSVEHHPGLTSSELGNLWNNYVDGSVVKCFLISFLSYVEDQEIRAILEEYISIIKQREAMIENILQKEGHQVPSGYSETTDLDLTAPRLFSDYFCLYYAECTQTFEIPLGGLDFVTSTRTDVLDYYAFRMNSSTMLFPKITNLLLQKGVYIRTPRVVTTEQNDIRDKPFLRGFLGKKRPLLAQEVSSIFHLMMPNQFARYMLMGFRQTASSKKVCEYMDRGINLSNQVIEDFGSILEAEAIPIPTVSDIMVTDSTVPPFSDRLMTKHLALFSICGMLTTSYLLINSLRHDIKATLAKLMPATASYAEDGIKLMIENDWYNEPPITVDRRELNNYAH